MLGELCVLCVCVVMVCCTWVFPCNDSPLKGSAIRVTDLKQRRGRPERERERHVDRWTDVQVWRSVRLWTNRTVGNKTEQNKKMLHLFLKLSHRLHEKTKNWWTHELEAVRASLRLTNSCGNPEKPKRVSPADVETLPASLPKTHINQVFYKKETHRLRLRAWC